MLWDKIKNNKLRFCCFLICLAVFAVSAYKLASTYIDYRNGTETYDNLRSIAFPDAHKEIVPDDISENKEAVASPATEQEQLENPPSDDLQETEEIDFSGLIEVNKDSVAWLKLPDTVVDYPVVHGSDNDYYLSHLISGERNSNGTLFVDYRNSKGFADKNTVVYGHHMQNGSMFALLEHYKEQSYYDEHSEFILYTPDKTYKLKPFAGIVVKGEFKNFPLSFDSDEEFLRYVKTSKENSTFESAIDMSSNDRIVTLCTCTYNFANARFALLCRLS